MKRIKQLTSLVVKAFKLRCILWLTDDIRIMTAVDKAFDDIEKELDRLQKV